MSRVINLPLNLQTPKDPRFLNITARMAYCNFMNSNDACSDCPAFEECIKWWDHHVCSITEGHLLTDNEMKQLISEMPIPYP